MAWRPDEHWRLTVQIAVLRLGGGGVECRCVRPSNNLELSKRAGRPKRKGKGHDQSDPLQQQSRRWKRRNEALTYVFGMPARSMAIRATFAPPPGGRTLPTVMSSISFGSMPDRSSVALKTARRRSSGRASLRPPFRAWEGRVGSSERARKRSDRRPGEGQGKEGRGSDGRE
jgi:hypothetical protein